MKVIGLVIFFGCSWLSWRQAQTWFANPRPEGMSLATFLEQPPKAQWLELSHCRINFTETMMIFQSDDDKRVDGYFVPLRPDFYDNSPAVVLMKVAVPSQIEMLRQLFDSNLTDAESKKLVLKNYSAFYREDTISGLIISNPDEDSSLRRALVQGDLTLSPDFVIIDPSARPKILPSTLLLGAGTLALLIAFSGLRLSKSEND